RGIRVALMWVRRGIPDTHMIRLEDQVEETGIVEAFAETEEPRALGQGWRGAPVEHDHGDLGSPLGTGDDRAGERRRVRTHEVEVARHQKTRYRRGRAAGAP